MITKKGIVSSAKMTGTISVTVHRLVSHPLYKKSFRVSKKFLADLNNIKDVMVGDEVLIEECRPLSKRKHFILKEVLKRVPRVAKMKEEEGLQEAMTSKVTKPIETSSASAPSDK
jgi:small subunit ribosomal protein S17